MALSCRGIYSQVTTPPARSICRDLHSYDRAIGPNGGYCHNPEQFNPLIEALDVEGEPQAFWGKGRVWDMSSELMPPPMAEECFRHAVIVGGDTADPAAAMRYAADTMLGAGEFGLNIPTAKTRTQR